MRLLFNRTSLPAYPKGKSRRRYVNIATDPIIESLERYVTAAKTCTDAQQPIRDVIGDDLL